MKELNILEGVKLEDNRIKQRREELKVLDALQEHITQRTEHRIKGNIEKAIQESENRKQAIINILNTAETPLKREILILRYVEYKTLTQAAEMLAYSEDHIRHLHAEALKEIQNRD